MNLRKTSQILRNIILLNSRNNAFAVSISSFSHFYIYFICFYVQHTFSYMLLNRKYFYKGKIKPIFH